MSKGHARQAFERRIRLTFVIAALREGTRMPLGSVPAASRVGGLARYGEELARVRRRLRELRAQQ
jgi:hypothetical protein